MLSSGCYPLYSLVLCVIAGALLMLAFWIMLARIAMGMTKINRPTQQCHPDETPYDDDPLYDFWYNEDYDGGGVAISISAPEMEERGNGDNP